jgi:hypothetical protein
LKQQDGGIHGLSQCTAEDELASIVRSPREPQMLGSVQRPALQIIRHELIQKKEMHAASRGWRSTGAPTTTAGGRAAASMSRSFPVNQRSCRS